PDELAVLASDLGLGVGVGNRTDTDGPVDGDAEVVDVDQPLAPAAREGPGVGHVGHDERGLEGRAAWRSGAAVPAVAGPGGVGAVAALADDSVGEVGQDRRAPAVVVQVAGG